MTQQLKLFNVLHYCGHNSYQAPSIALVSAEDLAIKYLVKELTVTYKCDTVLIRSSVKLPTGRLVLHMRVSIHIKGHTQEQTPRSSAFNFSFPVVKKISLDCG